jgi:hypothetical protein
MLGRRSDWTRRRFGGAEEQVGDGYRCHTKVESKRVAAIPAALGGGEPVVAVLQMHRLSSESGAQRQG